MRLLIDLNLPTNAKRQPGSLRASEKQIHPSICETAAGWNWKQKHPIHVGCLLFPPVSPLLSQTENVTEIKTNIFVTSFGPVSDTEMVSLNAVHTSPEAVGCF